MSPFTMGSDAGLSDEAKLLHDARCDYVVSSPSVDARSRLDILQEVQNVAQACAREDWDGNGASAVEQSTLTYATKFVYALPSGFSAPSVFIDRDGDIAFDWGSTARRTFSVSVARDGTLTYAGVFDQARTRGRESFSGAIPASILANIERASR